MATLLENINNIRENTIATHYAAARAQLEESIAANALKTSFCVSAGCISKEITQEIAHRFNQEGIKSTVTKGGFFTTQWYITAEPALPSNLVHEEEIKTEIVGVTGFTDELGADRVIS
jgi:hypothetical protein